MEEQGEYQVVAARPELFLTGPGDAFEHRVDRLEVAGVGGHLDAEPPAVRRGVLASGAQVVLDVTGEVTGVVGLLVADELVEDGGEVLLGGVGQHVQPAAVRHAEHDLFHPGVGGGVEHHVEQRDEALGALQAEALGAEEFGVEEPLEALRLDQLGEYPSLLVGADGRCRSLGVLLDPQFLVGLLDVHVLDARRSAVGVAQHAEDLAERHPGAAGQPSGGELTVEVPQAEPVGDRVELVVDLRRLLAQRVEVGDEMASNPVHVDELEDAGLLLGPPLAPRGRVGVDRPLDRDVGDGHRGEHVLVEAVGAEQQLVDPRQEHPALRTLDDAVVVGAGHGEGAAQPGPGERLRVGSLVLRGEPDPADADDQPLLRHQPGDRLDGAHRPRVGQGGGGPGEVVGGHRPGPHPAHHLLVRLPVAAEVHLVDPLQVGDEQGAAAVLAGQVHRQPQIDVGVGDPGRLAAHLGVGGVHQGLLGQGTDHRPPDEVGEADLAALGEPLQLVVDDRPVDLEQLGGEGPHRGGGGQLATRLHPVGDGGGGAPQDLGALGGLDRRRR